MSKSHAPAIRALLREHLDGLTLADISQHIKVPPDIVYNSIKRMPDAYTDRWEKAPRGQYAAVFCVVVPPPDCPHPNEERRSKTRPSEGARL